MHAEIISIGSELTSGHALDTNSQWLSLRLAGIGIPVAYHTTVADDLAANVDVVTTASCRADLVITTGGLGPTQDDLTREALATAAGVKLVLHADLLDGIRSMFAARGRAMAERNRVQAFLPAGAEAIPNLRGTAPGIWMKLGQAWVAALPGVPSEMFAMFDDWVRPRLESLGFGGSVVIQRKINTFGAGESVIEAKLLDLTRRGHVPEVGITVSDAVVSLRITAKAATNADALAQIEPVEATIRERLGDLVFGVESEEIEDAVVSLLSAQRKTIATAESVTCGLVARKLGRVAGASAVLRGGVVAYVNEIKSSVLGVPETLLREHGAVSAPVVEAMAAGARQLLGTNLAISTSGLAGPGGGTDEKPVGLVFAGMAWDGGVSSTHFNWHGTREEIQSRTARMALNMVRLHLLRRNS